MPILIPRMRTTVAVKAGVRRSARNAIRMSCLKRSIIDLLDPCRRALRSSFTRRLLLYKYLYEVVRNRVSKRRHFNHTMDSLRQDIRFAFAALALVLSAAGVYGVMSYGVSQRTREIGIRVALVARAGEIITMVLGGATRLMTIGIAAGLLTA